MEARLVCACGVVEKHILTMDTATDDMIWGLIRRLQGAEGNNLSPRAVARLHQIIDEYQPDAFPDTESQTAQAKWIAQRIDREP